ncbi:hypothetical protein JCM3766R1_007166 [Sporobolomyces carnicolor]
MSPHSQPMSSPREQLRTLWLDACEASKERAQRAENRGDRGWEGLWRAYWGFVIIEWVVARMTEPQWGMEDAVMVELVVEGKEYLQSNRDPSQVSELTSQCPGLWHRLSQILGRYKNMHALIDVIADYKGLVFRNTRGWVGSITTETSGLSKEEWEQKQPSPESRRETRFRFLVALLTCTASAIPSPPTALVEEMNRLGGPFIFKAVSLFSRTPL